MQDAKEIVLLQKINMLSELVPAIQLSVPVLLIFYGLILIKCVKEIVP